MQKLLAVFMTALVLPFLAIAQDDRTSAAVNGADARIVGELLAANSYEITLMKMASEKATNQELRNAVSGMLVEQQKMDALFTAYANCRNLPMNPEKREKYMGTATQMQSEKPGSVWDNNLVGELTTMHRDELDMLRAAERDVKDGELRKLAVNAIPVIQSNLDRLTLLRGIVTGQQASNAEVADKKAKSDKHDVPDGEKKEAKLFSDLQQMNNYELQLMELILKKGDHRALKDAAQRMLEDHQKLDARLKDYGSTRAFSRAEANAQAQEKANKWRQKKGGMEWDADIIEELIDMHKDGIDVMQNARDDIKDDALMMLINETLPVLQSHEKMLASLKETVKKPWKKK